MAVPEKWPSGWRRRPA